MVDQRSGNVSAPAPAAGKLSIRAVQIFGEAAGSSRCIYGFRQSAASEAIETGAGEQIFPNGEERVQDVFLKDHADLAADGLILPSQAVTADLDGAAIGGQKGAEHADGGGFARAVGAQEGKKLTALNVEADVFDCRKGAEAFAQLVDRNDRVYGQDLL